MFFNSIQIAALGLASSVFASPIANDHTGAKAQSYIAEYDDFPVSPATATNPIKDYEGLTYNAFSIVSIFTTGAIPPTKPNVASYGIKGIVTNGPPYIAPTAAGSLFNVDSFYYGCMNNAVESVALVPLACNITITGYKGSKKSGQQTLTYEPSDLTAAPMDFVRLGSWARGLTKLGFETDNLTGLALSTPIDSLKYTVYFSK